MNQHNLIPRIGSLCTGYGGLDIAVLTALATGHIAWVAENDPAMTRLLASRVSNVTNLGDITTIDWRSVPSVDILTAGFPCQDISTAGKRQGIQKGNRSGLFYNIMDAIRVLRPHYIILENVAALRWKNGGLNTVLGHLAQAGYDTHWTSLRASDIGAPHRRERVFLLAHPTRQRRPDWLRSWPTPCRQPSSGSLRCGDGLPHPDSQSGRQPLLLGWTTAQAVTGYPHQAVAAHPHGVGGNQGITPRAGLQGTPQAHRHRDQPSPNSTDRRQPQEPTRDPAATLRPRTGTSSRHHRGNHAQRTHQLDRSTPIVDWGEYTAIRHWELVLGRPAPPPTEPGTTGRPRLAPRFVEWMMGLTEGWVTDPDLGLSRNAQLRALGNGVVPQQAATAITLMLPDLATISAPTDTLGHAA